MITATSEDLFDVQLYSMEGKRVAESKNNYFRGMITTTDLAQGIYVLVFSSGKAA